MIINLKLRKCRLSVTIVFTLFYLLGHDSLGQEKFLWSPNGNSARLESSDNWTKEYHFDLSLLRSVNLAEKVQFELKGESFYFEILSKRKRKEVGSFIVGNITSIGTDEYVGLGRILINGDGSSGFLSVKGKIYDLKSSNSSCIVDYRYEADQCIVNLENNSIPVSVENKRIAEIGNSAPLAAFTEPLYCGDVRVFNLMLAFSPEAFSNPPINSSPEAMRERAIEITESVNQNFLTSNLDLRARLVHVTVLNESEQGHTINDFNAFGATADGQWDNLHGLKTRFKSDVIGVIISTQGTSTSAGFGQSLTNRFIYVSNNNLIPRGASHEIGHILQCFHHRDSYNWGEKVLFDGFKSYGQRGTNFKTLMVQTGVVRTDVFWYSDPNRLFPDGEAGGSSKANAAGRIEGSGPLVSNYTPQQKLPTNLIIDYVLADSSSTAIFATNSIKLVPGFSAKLGSSFIMDINSCISQDDIDY